MAEGLYTAAKDGRINMVHGYLATSGVIVDMRGGSDGDTPLYAACLGIRNWQIYDLQRMGDSVDHAAVVTTLLNHGADANARSAYDDETPLLAASRAGRVDVVSILLERGANPFLKNNKSIGPLHAAVRHRHLHVVKELLRNGADVNELDSIGDTPLQVAVELQDIDTVVELLARGAFVDVQRKIFKGTPLCFAAMEGYTPEAEALLRANADPAVTGMQGKTPLHHAAEWGHVCIMTSLLRHGAFVDPVDDLGRTPLMAAVEECKVARGPERTEAIRLLLEHGASIDHKDRGGETALQLATRLRRKEQATFLREVEAARGGSNALRY